MGWVPIEIPLLRVKRRVLCGIIWEKNINCNALTTFSKGEYLSVPRSKKRNINISEDIFEIMREIGKYVYNLMNFDFFHMPMSNWNVKLSIFPIL